MTYSRPQRVAPPAPIGSLLKSTAPAPPSRKADGYQDRDYLALVRQCPCLCCGMEPSEAAHVRYASAAHGVSSGLARKPPDRRNYRTIVTALRASAATDNAALIAAIPAMIEALERLTNAKALYGVRQVVAGWNGEGRSEPFQHRHPDDLGATLPKTTCGAIYDLDDALQSARAVLASIGKKP